MRFHPIQLSILGGYFKYSAASGLTCNDPIPISCGDTVTGSTVGIPNDNLTSGAAVCEDIGQGGQKWYVLDTLPSAVTLQTCDGSDYDTRLLVFTGECGAMTCVGNNDDFCGAQSMLSFTTVGYTKQLISIGGYESETGTFSMTVSCTPLSPPSTCSDIPSDSSWYKSLLAAGLAASSPFADSVALRTAIGGSDTLLIRHLDYVTNSCAIALLAFANSVFAAKTDAASSCTTDYETSDACIIVLYDAIVTLNRTSSMGGKNIVTGVARITTCSDIPANATWYTKLVSHVVTTGTTTYLTGTALETVLTVSPLTMNFHLSYGDTCGLLLLAFRNTAAGLYATASTPCASSLEGSAACLVVLYDAINTLNASVSMDGEDIVTGVTSIRCSTTDWVAHMLSANRWTALLSAKANSSGRVATSLACDSCITTLYAALPTTGDCFGSDAAFSDACRADPTVAPALSAFAACTGGHYMNTYGCTHLTDAVFDYHPFQAYVACSASALSDDFKTCLGATMSRTIAPTAGTCDPCYTAFNSAIRSKSTGACSANKYSQGCIDVFDTQPTTGPLGSPLKEFEICTKMTVDRTDMTCSSVSWSSLLPEYTFFAPIYAGAIALADVLAVGTMIANVTSFDALEAAIDGLACKSCFNIFAADVFTLWQSGATSACSDPTSPECATALSIPLDAFEYCSGQVLDFGSPPPDDCSDIPEDSTWYDALVNAGVTATSAFADSHALRAAIGLPLSLLSTHLKFSTNSCTIGLLSFANNVFAAKNLVNTDCATETSNACIAALYGLIVAVNLSDIMAGKDIVTGVDLITTCADMTPDSSWYTKLVSHVVTTGITTYASGAELKSALTSPDLKLSFHLSYEDTCGLLLLAFRNTAAGLYATASTPCASSLEGSAACLVVLYDAINTVNASDAMGGGGGYCHRYHVYSMLND